MIYNDTLQVVSHYPRALFKKERERERERYVSVFYIDIYLQYTMYNGNSYFYIILPGTNVYREEKVS